MRRILIQLFSLICGFGIVAWAQPDVNNKQAGSISGHVTRNGEPMRDVSVFARRANQLSGWEYPGVSVKTDSIGSYMFSGLRAGAYMIVVQTREDVLLWGNPPRQVADTGNPVVVKAGETVTGVDLSFVKGAVISGTVLDENDKPVVRTAITLLQYAVRNVEGQRAEFSPSHWYLINSTDEQGRYRLTGLPAGKYLVRVGYDSSAPPNQGKFYPFTFAPGTSDEARARIIEVTEGREVAGVNIKLRPPEPLYTAQGRLVDAATGLPLVGVRIRYATVFSSGEAIRLLRGTRERTNAQGEFQLVGLRPGKHVACLMPEDAPEYYPEWTSFEIDASDATGLQLKAARGSSLSGVVSIAGATSSALPPDRSNLVVVYAGEINGLPTPRANLPRVKPDGSFLLTGLKPGKIRLHVNNANFAAPRVFLLRTEHNGVIVPDGWILVPPGGEVSNIRLVIGSGTGVIRGQFTFTGGSLPAGDPLRVLLDSTPGETVQDRRATIVDKAGRFLIDGLLPGEYDLHIIVPGTLRLPSSVVTRLSTTRRIKVAANGEVYLPLTGDLSEERK